MPDGYKQAVEQNGRSNDTPSDSWSRRKYLAATAGSAMLAGCSTDGETDTPSGNSNGENTGTSVDTSRDIPEDVEIMSRLGSTTIPQDMNFNFFSNNSPGGVLDLGTDMFACSPSPQGELKLRGLDDWEWDPDTSTLTKTLRDDLVFWNGDQLTAEDVYVFQELQRLVAPESSAYESIEQSGDLSVDFVLKDPPNRRLVRNLYLPGRASYHNAEQWTEWLEKFQDVSTDSAEEELTSDLTEYTVTIDEFVDNGWGTGVFEVSDWDETQVLLEPVSHGNHRNSDAVDIEGLRMYLTGYDSAKADQLFINGEIDFHTSALPPEYKGSVPDYVQNTATWELMFGYQLLINQSNHEDLQDYNVRRAMASVINTQNIVTNFGETRSNPIQTHAGMEPGSNRQYWGDELDDLIDYAPQATDNDLADHFLELSGYSREDGTILRPDGEEMEPITFVTGSDFLFKVPSKTASLQMEKYGFPVEYNAVPRSQKMTTINDKMGEWDLSMESHYAAADNHASSFFDNGLWGYRLDSGDGVYEDWIAEGKERSEYTGRPLTPEVPTTIGQEDLSGSTKEVNIPETYKKIRQTNDQETINQGARDLSWMWNFHVPNIQVLYLIAGTAGNTKDYDWPSESEIPKYSPNPPYRLIHDGTMTYSDY